jgi:hypothetical protein
VNYSPALRWFLILLFPLFLGWKLAAGAETPHMMTERMVAFLTRHQFEVVVTDKMNWNDFPLMHASAGACQLVIAEESADGWNSDIIRNLTKSMDRSFIVYRGAIYFQRPGWMTLTHYWWSKYLHKVGLGVQEMPVIAVAETASCKADQLPWNEF